MVRKNPKRYRRLANKKNDAQSALSPTTSSGEIGRVIIAPQVLATVARTSALSVAGVVGMSNAVPGSFSRFRSQDLVQQGVRLEMKEQIVNLDLYLVARPNVDLYAMSQSVQKKVARAIQELVGMEVGAVNVHIEEIAFPERQDKKK